MKHGIRHECLIAVLLIVAGGCHAPRAVRDELGMLGFPDEQAAPRVVVYGSMRDLLPQFDATPALELFLYGPSDYGKTMLRNPQGMARHGSVLFVCDQGRPDIVRIDLASGRSERWCDVDHRPRCPVDVVVDAAGLVYVADTTVRSVLVYGADGTLLRELTPDASVVSSGTDEVPAAQRTFRPCSLALGGGTLYVGNTGHRRVDRWDMQSSRWLAPLVAPEGAMRIVAPTGLDLTPEGTLLIADSIQCAVLRVRTDGTWMPPIGRAGRGEGEFVRPKQVRSTQSGLIFVSDAGRQSVLAFRGDGTFLTEVHERDRWKGFTLPAGLLAISAGTLPVGDALAKRNLSEPDEYVIVSDSMGGTSLTLLGIFTRATEVAHAR